MVQKASTPWSARTVAEGGTDSPVGDLVPVPDEIKPVVSTGFIATTGKFTGLSADDLAFTFQDPNQALAAGADLDFNVNMLEHETMILAILDSSGNTIDFKVSANNPTILTGPYTPFTVPGVNGAYVWRHNSVGATGDLKFILSDDTETLAATWQFYKICHLRGMHIRFVIHNNESSNAGTISTAYLRLVH